MHCLWECHRSLTTSGQPLSSLNHHPVTADSTRPTSTAPRRVEAEAAPFSDRAEIAGARVPVCQPHANAAVRTLSEEEIGACINSSPIPPPVSPGRSLCKFTDPEIVFVEAFVRWALSLKRDITVTACSRLLNRRVGSPANSSTISTSHSQFFPTGTTSHAGSMATCTWAKER